MEIFIFIFGSIIGSFISLCSYRIPKNKSIIYPPSYCINCNTKIKWYDLIPILSYFILKGKCRNCKNKISLRNPILEMLTGIIFLVTYYKFGFSFYTLKYIVFQCLLILIALIDIDTTNIYFKISEVSIISAIFFIIIEYFRYGVFGKSYIFGGILGLLFSYTIVFLSREKAMGMGDVEIFFFSGLFLGLKNTLIMIYLSFVIGAVISIILVILKVKKLKNIMPFGPFIAMGCIMTIFLGDIIYNYYLNLIYQF